MGLFHFHPTPNAGNAISALPDAIRNSRSAIRNVPDAISETWDATPNVPTATPETWDAIPIIRNAISIVPTPLPNVPDPGRNNVFGFLLLIKEISSQKQNQLIFVVFL